MTATTTATPCLRCQRPRTGKNNGRDLCSVCYHHCYNTGTLDDYPRITRRREDLVLDVHALLAGRESPVHIAHRLDMKPEAIARACYRAKRPDLARPFNLLVRRARLAVRGAR